MEAVKGLRLPTTYVEVSDNEMEYLDGGGVWPLIGGVILGFVVDGVIMQTTGKSGGEWAGEIVVGLAKDLYNGVAMVVRDIGDAFNSVANWFNNLFPW